MSPADAALREWAAWERGTTRWEPTGLGFPSATPEARAGQGRAPRRRDYSPGIGLMTPSQGLDAVA